MPNQVPFIFIYLFIYLFFPSLNHQQQRKGGWNGKGERKKEKDPPETAKGKTKTPPKRTKKASS